MGTPDFSVPVLDAVVEAGHKIVAVYTQPPRPAGRGKRMVPSPVQARAEALGLPVRSPASLKGQEEQAAFAALGAEAAVVAAYGLILPRPVLEAPGHGCLNVHASLLPRWRGAAPIQRAILAGDVETGVCIMQMEAGLDTGPVRLCKSSWIGNDNAGRVSERLSKLGARLIVEVLADLDMYPLTPQANEGVTYASKVEKSEARLNFDATAVELERRVRAFNPSPGAYLEFAGERIRVLSARAIEKWPGYHETPGILIDLIEARSSSLRPGTLKHSETFVISCREGYLQLKQLQRAGKKAMSAEEVLRGLRIQSGTLMA